MNKSTFLQIRSCLSNPTPPELTLLDFLVRLPFRYSQLYSTIHEVSTDKEPLTVRRARFTHRLSDRWAGRTLEVLVGDRILCDCANSVVNVQVLRYVLWTNHRELARIFVTGGIPRLVCRDIARSFVGSKNLVGFYGSVAMFWRFPPHFHL